MHEFTAPRWLSNPHLQTLGAALPLWAPPPSFRASGGAAGERMVLPVGEGGALVGRAWWHEGGAPRTVAVLLHGVGGTSESRYLVRAAVALHRAGLHVVRMNLRGVGDGLEEGTSLYHASLTADVDRALALLAEDARVKDVALVGFSCGGTSALTLAARWGATPPAHARAVVSISAPLDLHRGSEILEQRMTLPYRAYVVRNLVRQAQRFAAKHPGRARYDLAKVARARTIRAFDEAVIVPMHGFASANEYYDVSSPGPRLGDVRVPTLLVHAADDPMVPGHTVEPFLRHASPAVEVAWSARGGHVAFVGGVGEKGFIETWPVARLTAWLAALS